MIWKILRKKLLWPNLNYYLGICLHGIRKMTKKKLQ